MEGREPPKLKIIQHKKEEAKKPKTIKRRVVSKKEYLERSVEYLKERVDSLEAELYEVEKKADFAHLETSKLPECGMGGFVKAYLSLCDAVDDLKAEVHELNLRHGL